jgi:NDP-sugar pyrophosphorylase family protein
MGNYSYLLNQEGCNIKTEQLKKDFEKGLFKKYDSQEKAFYYSQEIINKIIDEGLGSALHGWKIHGYWYDNFKTFLYVMASYMDSLTSDYSKNFIEMEEEQGYKFMIHFAKIDNEIKIKIGFVPMDWVEVDLNEV